MPNLFIKTIATNDCTKKTENALPVSHMILYICKVESVKKRMQNRIKTAKPNQILINILALSNSSFIPTD